MLPSGVAVSAVSGTTITPSNPSYSQIISALGGNGYENVFISNIKLLNINGNPIIGKLNGYVTVKIKVPDNVSTANLKVLWYNPEDPRNPLTDVGAVLDGGYLVFQTNHFSAYVIARPAANPYTGDSSDNIPVFMFYSAAILFIIITGLIL